MFQSYNLISWNCVEELYVILSYACLPRNKWVLDSTSGNNVCIYERLIWWVCYEAKIPQELLGRSESNIWEKPCDKKKWALWFHYHLWLGPSNNLEKNNIFAKV